VCPIDPNAGSGGDPRDALEATLRTIREALGGNPAFKRVDERLFVVKQGSAYVMICAQPFGDGAAIVRLAAQVVTGIDMTGELATRLLKLNARLRFGTFGYLEEGGAVTLSHTMLGGESLAPEALLAVLEHLARLADELDDKLVALGGGDRMVDLLQEDTVARLKKLTLNEGEAWDEHH
jgi:hypothetical protein